MSKIGKSILKGAHEAFSFAKGQKKGSRTHNVIVQKVVNVRESREKLNMSRTVDRDI